MKTCPSCGSEYPATTEFFYKGSRGGLFRKCKACHCQSTSAWQKAHRERVSEYSKRYRRSNPDAVKRQWSSWYTTNRQYERERQANKYAHRKSATGSYTADDVQFIYEYQGGRCFYCLQPVGRDFHRDHFIPLAKGGSNDWTNIVVSCAFCNSSKRDIMPNEFGGFMSPLPCPGAGPSARPPATHRRR